MDNISRNDSIQRLIVNILENGLENNYSLIVEVLDTQRNADTDALVFFLENMGYVTAALTFVIQEYKIARVRDVLHLQLKDFSKIDIKKDEEFFEGKIAEAVTENNI